jgi:protease I
MNGYETQSEENPMKTILALVDDIYEDLELLYPKLRLEEEGWKVVVGGS